MKFVRESEIRDGVDEPTLKMLDLWHELVSKEIGPPIEVGVACRKDFPQFKDFSGEFHTATPMTFEGKPFLVLIFDDLSKPIEDVLITHELGHWVLFLQGFAPFRYTPNRNCNNEILLNSMAHHPPLYDLQRTLGHEPQKEIDKRAKHNINLASKQDEVPGKPIWERNALMVADDLLNCSTHLKEKLLEIVQEKHPCTAILVGRILKSDSSHDLLDQSENKKFIRKVIQDLGIGPGWLASHKSTLEDLKKMAE